MTSLPSVCESTAVVLDGCSRALRGYRDLNVTERELSARVQQARTKLAEVEAALTEPQPAKGKKARAK